jgi:site-specific recombinase XerD
MDTLWLTKPLLAYADWQEREAAGADRRPFAERSIVQHRAMFKHFYGHLLAAGATVASFGPDHIEGFWQTEDAAGYTATTRMRYLKLLDRLCRHLVAIGVRQSNPAGDLARAGRWPQSEPEPIYLTEEADLRLQAYVQPNGQDDLSALRARSIVALFLATGISSAEGRAATKDALQPVGLRPYLHVAASGPRSARTVHLEDFAVPILSLWQERRSTLPIKGDLLFTLRATGEPITDMSLGLIVRRALEAIDFEAEDMSPRILRNTYGRRQLIAGVARDEVSQRLGLSSNRTCDRLQATIGT